MTPDELYSVAAPIFELIKDFPREDQKLALEDIVQFVESMLRHPGTTGRV